MPHIYCLAKADTDNHYISFKWAEGPAFFKAYSIEGTNFQKFLELARDARLKLQELVVDYHGSGSQLSPEVRLRCYELADIGYSLYISIFPPPTDQNVEHWLQTTQIDSLELVLDGPRFVPWNVLYGREPKKESFFNEKEWSDACAPFWGLRYNLACTRKLDPLRRRNLNEDRLLIVLNEEVFEKLEQSERDNLDAFMKRHRIQPVYSRKQLRESLRECYPDIMYWLCHATPEALELKADKVTPFHLQDELDRARRAHSRNHGGLAILNACRTGQEGKHGGSFLDSIHEVGFRGLVATDELTIDNLANRLGIAFLAAFCEDREAVGSIVHRLRREYFPLGLLYTVYCPPHLRLRSREVVAEPPIQAIEPIVGQFLGSGPGPKASPALLPAEPYRSLSHYDREHRALFAGRERDVERFADQLDDEDTKILLLHGETGVGKTSFLRAGLLPYLEEEGAGYQFLRDRRDDEFGPALFIRATNDLASQIGQALLDFCARPFTGRSPLGEEFELNLLRQLSETIGGAADPLQIREALGKNPVVLGRAVTALAEVLPFTLLLVIDQAEEIFTLNRSVGDLKNQQLALELLRQLAHAPGDFKVIVSLRTEYHGRLVHQLRRGFQVSHIRDYLLEDLDEEELVKAIVQPTSEQPVPYSDEVPFTKYGFRYGDGVAKDLAEKLRAATLNRQDSALPLAQVICSQLYEHVRQRRDRTIARKDIDDLEGIEGGLRRYVDTQLARIVPEPQDLHAFKQLLAGLYLHQPDGALTTALEPEDQAAKRWSGERLFTEVVQEASAADLRLLRVNVVRLGGARQRRYLSLGHDALAKVAADWDEEFKRAASVRRLMGGLALLTVVLVIVGALAVSNFSHLQQTRRVLHRISVLLAHDAWDDRKPEVMKRLLAGSSPTHQDWEWHYLRTLADKTELATLDGQTGPLTTLALCPHDKYLAFGGKDGRLSICDINDSSVPTIRFSLTEPFTGPIRAIAFLRQRDKPMLAVACEHDLYICDVEAQAARKLPVADRTGFKCLAVHPKSNHLAVGSESGPVWIFDSDTGTEIHVLNPIDSQPNPVFCVVYSENGERLAFARSEQPPEGSFAHAIGWGEVEVRDTRTWETVCEMRADTGPIYGLTFNPDKPSELALACFDSCVRVWNTLDSPPKLKTVNSNCITTVAMHMVVPVLAVAYSPNGERLASGSADQSILFSDPSDATAWRSGQENLPCLIGHNGHVNALAFSARGDTLFSASSDGTLKVWSTSHTPGTVPFLMHTLAPTDVVFRKDGERIASSSLDRTVRIWDPKSGTEEFLLTHDRPLHCLDFSPDQHRLAAGDSEGTVVVWDANSRAKLFALRHSPNHAVSAVSYSEDGRYLASACDTTVKLWSPKNGEVLATISSETAIYDVAFSPRGPLLAFACADGTVRVWNTKSAKELWHAKHTEAVYCVAFDGTSEYLASGGADKVINIWNMQTGQLIRTIKGQHTEPITSLAFNPRANSRRLVSGSQDASIRIWDTTTGEPVFVQYHNLDVYSVSFSPDGFLLASTSCYADTTEEDGGDLRGAGIVKIWNATPGRNSARSQVIHSPLPSKRRSN